METMQNGHSEISKKNAEELEEAIFLINRVKDILEKYKVIEDEKNTPILEAVNPTFNLELNHNKSFQNFFEGKSNKLARSVGISIAEQKETKNFNPFLIYGTSGCGKSHLINAIGVRAKELFPDKLVVYLNAHLFLMHYTDARKRNLYNEFLHFYQSVDMLIIDDIQEWKDAPNTLKAFYQIVSHLIHHEKQIILTSDRPPVNLKSFNKNLVTHLIGGLVTELEKPDLQLCLDILNDRCHRDSMKISKEVIEFVAMSANDSVSSLESVYNSLKAYSTVNNSKIDIRLAKRVIKRFVKLDEKKAPKSIKEKKKDK